MAVILIIDDDPHMRATLRRILGPAKHTVLEAANGREGLATFKEHAPQVVICDIIMPEKEGVETILTLRRMSAETGIVAISGGGHAGKMDFLSVAKKLGANCVLQKPIRGPELVEAVNALVPAAGAKPPA